MRRPLLVAAVTVVALLALLFVFRRWALLAVFALVVGGDLLEPSDEGPKVEWFDDYYTVEILGPGTIAIGEPRFSQQNYNYLLLGKERALLFDSGPGVRDIRPVVSALTDLPVTALPSHLHYDHIGGYEDFPRVAMVDLPALRTRAPDGFLRPTIGEHLGFLEGLARPTIQIDEWVAPEAEIDLGARAIRVLHTPGHTPESISLYDPEAGMLFSGDYLTPEGLLAFAPGSSLADYLWSAERLVEALPVETRIHPAHRVTPPGAPVMRFDDLADLRTTLRAIRDGSATSELPWPRVFRVNAGIALYADFGDFESAPRSP